MLPLLRNITTIALISVLIGCAGKDFVRPDTDTLRNGQTTYAQAIEKLGEPRREGTALKNDKKVKTASYGFASMGGKPAQESIVPARAMTLYFSNDILVGYEFVSSFADDHTNFDEDKISSIVKGESTQSEVVKLLGRPSGYYIHPLTKATTGQAMAYVYVQVAGGPFSMRMYRKVLIVTMDDSGVVKDVEFSSEGNK